MFFFRAAVAVFAIILIIVGAITAISPIPFGLPLLALGVLLLASAAPALLRRWRRHWRWLDRVLHAAQKRLPNWIADRLRRSDPHSENCDEDDEASEDAKVDEDDGARAHDEHPDAAYIRFLLRRA